MSDNTDRIDRVLAAPSQATPRLAILVSDRVTRRAYMDWLYQEALAIDALYGPDPLEPDSFPVDGPDAGRPSPE